LLADLQQPTAEALSGTVVSTAELGLPQLPSTGQGASDADLMALAAGSTTARVWYDGPERARVALIGQASQTDVIRNGNSMWVWSSAERTAQRMTLPEMTDADKASGAMSTPTPTDVPSSPQEAAEQALALIGDSTDVSNETSVQVAGRDAYQLVLNPTQDGTLVDRVTIAMDGETNVPLRVQVYSTKMAQPAYQVGFTSIDYSTPDARQFEFTPPPGTEVEELDMAEAMGAELPAKPGGESAADGTSTASPTVVGADWTQVVLAQLGQGIPTPAEGDDEAEQAMDLLTALPEVSGEWGSGRLMEGTLFSAILTDDGRLAMGAVTPQALYDALQQ
jgi:outer membrane lipoprotein-sorting protein